MDLIGRYGDKYYVIEKSTGLVKVFDSFGELKGNSTLVSVYSTLAKTLRDVEYLSILGESGSKVCDIYYRGKSSLCSMSYLDAFTKTKGTLERVYPQVFRVSHPEGVVQIILPIKPSTLSTERLEEILQCSLVWGQ